MNTSILLLWQLKAAVGLAIVLLVAHALRRAPARVRRSLLGWGTLAALLVPLLGSAVAPLASLDVPVAAPAVVADTPLPSLLVEGTPAEPTVGATPATEAAEATAEPIQWATLAALLWAIGAVFVATRVAAGLVGGTWLVRRSRRAPRLITEQCAALAKPLGVTASVRLHDRPAVPLVVGWRTPTILLPRIATRWSSERLQAVLLHELGHVRHRDGLWFPALDLARALAWANPLVWLAVHRFRHEAEYAADDAALGSMRASAYAAELLTLAEVTLSPLPSIPAPALGHPELGTRVRRLLSDPAALIRLRTVVPLSLATAGALVTVALLRAGPADDPGVASVDENQWAEAEPTSKYGLAVVDAATVTRAAPKQYIDIKLTPDRLFLRTFGGHTDIPAQAGVLAPGSTRNHLIGALYEQLEPDNVPKGNMLFSVHPDVPWPTVIDVLYTAGRAGARDYDFAVEQAGQRRAFSVTPPRYPADAAAPHFARVTWTQTGGRKFELYDGAADTGPLAVWTTDDAQPNTLRAAARKACANAPNTPVEMRVSPPATVRFGDVVPTLSAVQSPCGGGLSVEAGSG